MSALPWIAIFLAAPAAFIASCRWVGLGLLIVGYGVALMDGHLRPWAVISVSLLFLAAYAVSPGRNQYVRYAGHALFVALAIALSMHWLPGFHNLRVIGPVRFTPDAVPLRYVSPPGCSAWLTSQADGNGSCSAVLPGSGMGSRIVSADYRPRSWPTSA